MFNMLSTMSLLLSVILATIFAPWVAVPPNAASLSVFAEINPTNSSSPKRAVAAEFLNSTKLLLNAAPDVATF